MLAAGLGLLLAAAPSPSTALGTGAARPVGAGDGPDLAAVAATLRSGAPETAQQPAADPLVVYLMTMGPGELIEERFGHNAIWIRDTVAGTDRLYNFGMFSKDQQNFYWNFTKGRPQYWLDVWSLDATLRVYASRRRTVEVQELALTAAQKGELAANLAFNASPENRTYTYDYYLDNCSTRVRDALDRVLGGVLRRATEGVPAEGSFRFHTQRSITNNPWLYLGILAAMGPRADAPRDQWDEMFLPEKVQERVRELTVVGDDGREVPLVVREATLLAFDAWQVEPAPPDWTWPLLGVGLLLAAAVASGLLRGGWGVPGRVLAGVIAVTAMLGGALLLFLWWFTDHVMTDRNANVLLLSPLAVTVPVLLAGRGGSRRWQHLALVGSGLAVLGGVLGAANLWQDNREVAALVLPPLLAAIVVAVAVSRRRAAAPPLPR